MSHGSLFSSPVSPGLRRVREIQDYQTPTCPKALIWEAPRDLDCDFKSQTLPQLDLLRFYSLPEAIKASLYSGELLRSPLFPSFFLPWRLAALLTCHPLLASCWTRLISHRASARVHLGTQKQSCRLPRLRFLQERGFGAMNAC